MFLSYSPFLNSIENIFFFKLKNLIEIKIGVVKLKWKSLLRKNYMILNNLHLILSIKKYANTIKKPEKEIIDIRKKWKLSFKF